MDERPKEFDDRVTAYLPGLRALAKRISSEPDELVSDTLIYAFKNWKSFRPDGAFWAWISLNMRSISQQRAKRNRLHTCRVDLAMLVPTPARQEHAVDLRRVRENLNYRAGICLLRHASGETYREIAADLGVSYERVHQLCDVARARLLSEVA